MIRKVVQKFYDDYYNSTDFRVWQNRFVNDIYSCLMSVGKEIPTVTALCDVMSEKRYRGLHIESKKIHSRSTSGVNFECRGKSVTKELADMVIVSLVTLDRQIVFMKTAFIQNKRATRQNALHTSQPSDSWVIDQEQLFLLKNFPTFTGASGLFNDIQFSFLNHSRSLGNYGLFSSNGDMTFLTAQNVFHNQNSNGRVVFDSIKRSNIIFSKSHINHEYFDKDYSRYCNCPGGLGCDDWMRLYFYNPPFFRNYSYALDVSEVVKELTYFNIGDLSIIVGHVTDAELYSYTGKLLLAAFGHKINEVYFRDYFNVEDKVLEMDDIDVNVVLSHVELGDNR
ncbi:MAG: hypothetical protein FWH37_07455 [Candidatus Bathyarchaeota archaeon]|nr:hypothetical protein [Candidatus Termiticorpusculum sp.]